MNLRRQWIAIAPAMVLVETMLAPANASGQQYRALPVKQYRERMKAGWIGQMVGVAWGGPTEMKFQGTRMPADAVPPSCDDLINGAFGQDDLCIDAYFLNILKTRGLDVAIRQVGIDFANVRFNVFVGNATGVTDLRGWIAPPDSGHPKVGGCCPLDYVIEADFAGLIAPRMPNVAIALGEKFGRLMCYGDGVYRGQFASARFSHTPEYTDVFARTS